jgi:O-antigen/teichoic acid export membrane protein
VLTSLLSFSLIQHLCFRRVGTAFDVQVARAIVDFQWPLIPGALVSFAARQSERVSLRFFESLEKVGVLEMAYKFPSLISMLIHEPFMNAWNTERLRLAQTGTTDASKKIGDTFTLAWFTLVLAGLLIALGIRDVLIVLTPPAFWEATRIAQIECLTLVLTCAAQHVNLGFLHGKDTRAWARMTSTISVAKIGLSVAFVASMGIWGAAYSAFLAAAVLFFLALRGGQSRYRIQYRSTWNLSIIGLALVLFCIVESGSDFFLEQSKALAATLTTLRITPLLMVNEWPWVIEKLPYIIDLLMRLLTGAGLLLLLPFIVSDSPLHKRRFVRKLSHGSV